MSSKLSDGLFIAVNVNGDVCVGANRSGVKLYVSEKVAIKKAGIGGKVYRVTDTAVTLVWPVARMFFLNEQHELPPRRCCLASGIPPYHHAIGCNRT